MENVSVVIPYFNDSVVLKRTIDSVVNQSLNFYEIILIDDFSDDSSIAISIIDAYEPKLRKKIHYYRNEKNMNGAYSRNFGIKKATGDYIALLDADDYWDEKHLEFSLNSIVEKNVDFIFSNIIFQKNNKDIIKVKVTNPDHFDNKNNILFDQPPQTNSFLFKRNTFITENIWFDETLRRHQDWQFLIDIINSKVKYSYVDMYTAYYCASHRSLLSRVNYDSIFRFWDKNYYRFSNKKLLNFLKKILIDASIMYDYEYLEVNFSKYNAYKSLKGDVFLFFLIKSNFSRKKIILNLYYYIFCDFKKGLNKVYHRYF